MNISYKLYLYPALITLYLTYIDILDETTQLVLGIVVLVGAAIFLLIDVLFHSVLKQGKTMKSRRMWREMKTDKPLWSRRIDVFVTAGLLAGSLWITSMPFLSLLFGVGTVLTIYKYWDHVSSTYKIYFDDPSSFI